MDDFKSQVCTSVEQSKRLLELGLKKETADIVWIKELALDEVAHCTYDAETYMLRPIDYLEGESHRGHIPAWSLHRLVILLPVEVIFNGYKFQLRKDVLSKIDDIDNVYDEVIGVIQRAIELDCFNKDYLEDEIK